VRAEVVTLNGQLSHPLSLQKPPCTWLDLKIRINGTRGLQMLKKSGEI
jgi:hypothetical protein